MTPDSASSSSEHLPQGHPPSPGGKVGVVLANLGTPDATDYWSVRRYLSEFLSDRRVVDYSPWLWQPLLQLVILSRRPFASGKAYRGIWNRDNDESPLLTITREQTEKLAAELKREHGERLEVAFCMRYGNPSTESVLKDLHARGCERILFFPLYPQYGSPTTATANDQAFRTLMKLKWQPALRTVPAYFEHLAYLAALSASVREAYAAAETPPQALVASYHGVPKRFLDEGDPYYCHCRKTTRLLKEQLGRDGLPLDDEAIITTFQSKFGPEEWVGPATVEHVAELARQGIKHLAVVSPAFAADCVETLEEIEEEIRGAFLEAGGETFTYVPCLNARDDHVRALARIAEQELAGWL
ncbi:ferrochelatase [Halomonas sabkhae]|uniref:ferrochelatase n=1 Tax=Halomonas sabkhae TaxID=626223 RepID=UPI0025B3F4E9|nr:ferrochelatase [Halomonas sabkhae]MDN3524266.1 ferrochelatase [Halomonas sabkhae]